MVRIAAYGSIVAAVGAGLFSCNLFSPTEDYRHAERYGPKSMVQEGKLCMRDSDWETAIDWFDMALDEDSSLSEAYFYKGKCILRLSDVDLNDVWTDINPNRPDTNSVPFLFTLPSGRSLDEDVTIRQDLRAYWRSVDPSATATSIPTLLDSVYLERKRMYDAVCSAIGLLEYIHYNPGKMDGEIVRKQYESDYLVEITVKAVLSLVDLNYNDSLEWGGEEQKAFRRLVQDIPSLEPDSMVLDSLKQISNDPKDINKAIDSLLLKLNQADTSYNNFHRELVEAEEETDAIDSDMAKPLGDIIGDLRRVAPFYYYNDFADNDSDWYDTDQNGRVDRMIWIDWDGDDMIDITANNTGHIGDDAHRQAYPAWYEDIDDADADYHRFIYKGPYTHEFIAGDWGVDEEILDGYDNDGDGLTDEDSRVAADSLDDDGDYYDTDPSEGDPEIDSSRHPMAWTSTADLSIDLTGGTGAWDTVHVDSLFAATYDSLYEAIYGINLFDPSARTAKYKIPVYRGRDYPGEFTGGDYGMDEEWFDGVDNDGDGLIDEDVGEAIPDSSLRQIIIQNQ
ncbi:MAG: hypothetical protein GF418_05380 [Chitinivibrionales bacterium]|nr:hypothetical protein [Chitinivibrionales bacterium]MBD3395043.1 hypothetical protein [Chitinivibrionales bacterium]